MNKKLYRTADAILRDLVASGVLPHFHSAIADEAREYVAHRDAVDLATKRAEREAEKRRKLRAEQDERRRGKFEIAPRREGGVDHARDGIVLLRKAGDRLVWRAGGKYWSSRDQKYAPAELEIIRPGKHRVEVVRLTDNHGAQLRGEKSGMARLSPRLLFLYGKEIDKHFGDGAWESAGVAFHLRETVVIR